jgi:hypothetical protein
MKQKNIKITQTTLFVYKSNKSVRATVQNGITDPTTYTTGSIINTTGIYQK